MREIKFKGKRVDGGEWVYGKDLMQHNKNSQVWIKDFDTSESDWKSVIPETLGQFTGLTDKNSKEIYEGDRVKTSGDNIFTIEFIGSGYFCKREDGLIISLDGINRIIEVIGTIFDKED